MPAILGTDRVADLSQVERKYGGLECRRHGARPDNAKISPAPSRPRITGILACKFAEILSVSCLDNQRCGFIACLLNHLFGRVRRHTHQNMARRTTSRLGKPVGVVIVISLLRVRGNHSLRRQRVDRKHEVVDLHLRRLDITI